MDFNVTAKFNDLLEEPFWLMSSKIIPVNVANRFELAYVEIRSMFIGEVPFLVGCGVGDRPVVGQIVPDVFYCDPSSFNFRDCFLVGSSFWDLCFHDLGFVDSLVGIGQLFLQEGGVEKQLRRWGYEFPFHSFELFLD